MFLYDEHLSDLAPLPLSSPLHLLPLLTSLATLSSRPTELISVPKLVTISQATVWRLVCYFLHPKVLASHLLYVVSVSN